MAKSSAICTVERSKGPGGEGVQIEHCSLSVLEQLDAGLGSHPEGDCLGRVVGELHRSRNVVDEHEAFVGHGGIAGTFAQLVLHQVGLVGDRVGRGSGVHRTVLAIHRDAHEVDTWNVAGGRYR